MMVLQNYAINKLLQYSFFWTLAAQAFSEKNFQPMVYFAFLFRLLGRSRQLSASFGKVMTGTERASAIITAAGNPETDPNSSLKG